MRIQVRRTTRTQSYTVSSMYLDGERMCYVLEDAVREILGQPVSSWKIPGKTAIPAGVYPVSVSWSGRFQKMLPLMKNVPGFDGIRIHPGNTDEDTEGCLLVGLSWPGGDRIGESAKAFSMIFPLIQSAWSLGELITLEIS